MKVAAAESAVLDSAATKEKEAHKRPAVQEHAELLSKREARPEAMQKALALQAEAREKIAHLKPF